MKFQKAITLKEVLAVNNNGDCYEIVKLVNTIDYKLTTVLHPSEVNDLIELSDYQVTIIK